MSATRGLLALLLAGAMMAGLAASAWGPEESAAEAEAAATSDGSALATPLAAPTLPYRLRQGKALFLHYCATCHGVQGRGDGFNAYSLDPKPRDLGDRSFLDQRGDEELRTVIRTGGGAIGLANAMPPWGRTLSARQIDQLVAYLRELPARAEEASGGP